MVGNDVVDLRDPETRLEGLHPRFEERVFSASERRALAASPERHRLHWALWAAKESAYKAWKRLDPATVFAPRELEVELAPVPVSSAGAAAGVVRHHGRTLDVELLFGDDHVHAVALSRGNGQRILAAVSTATDEPGAAVRRCAAAAIARALALEPERLRITGRPPEVRHLDDPLDVVLSLSHHGRFVAFAASLPQRR